jgi:hypothetical protein
LNIEVAALHAMRFFSSTSHFCACAATTMTRRPASVGVVVTEVDN